MKLRGFAAMTPEKRKAAAVRGGVVAQALGTAHKWTPEEARIAGSKGGMMSSVRRRALKQQEEVNHGGTSSDSVPVVTEHLQDEGHAEVR